jgi:hypothetical protein
MIAKSRAGRVFPRRARPPSRPRPPWTDLLRHPLVLLAAGAVLTALVVPRINELATRSRIREEQRQKTAISILQNASKTERLINAAITTLEQFEKDVARHHLTGARLAERQAELEKRSRAQYDEINDLAWWWPWDAPHEGEITHFISAAGITTFRLRIEQYNALVTEFGNHFFRRRDALLARDYDPGTIAQVESDVATFRKEMDSLRDKRTGLAATFCNIVMGSR